MKIKEHNGVPIDEDQDRLEKSFSSLDRWLLALAVVCVLNMLAVFVRIASLFLE